MSLNSWTIALVATVALCPALAGAQSLELDESRLPRLQHFSPEDLDSATPACADFNRYVNERWLDANPIPADKASWGTLNILNDRSIGVQRQIAESLAKNQSQPGSNAQKIGDVYRSGLDVARLNREGIAPLQPTLSRIGAIDDREDIAQFLYDSFAKGGQQLFLFAPESDLQQPDLVIGYTFQSGISLPERAYYLGDSYKAIREAFLAHVARLLELSGVAPEAAKTQAQAVLAFETRLAAASLSQSELRDSKNTYHVVTIAEAEAVTPHFSWSKLFAAEKLAPQRFSMGPPKFFAEMDKLLAEAPIADWQAYLRYHALSDAAPYLSESIDDEKFAFYSTRLNGQPNQRPRWKRVLDTINENLGEALGQLYVAQAFPESSKTQARELAGHIVAAARARVAQAAWMSPGARAEALTKLSTVDLKIGYPDQWRDYSNLRIDSAASYFADVEAMREHANAYEMSRIGKPGNRGEWGMSPQTVNAFYNPQRNELVFTAAMLQPPLFDAKADAALNYGGIGSLIGHEITFAFDEQGSRFDARGRLADWWTSADHEAFRARTAKLVGQFNEYEVSGSHVNGQLTLDENVADLAGLRFAYDALHHDSEQNRSDPIDGLTQDQRFFLSFATIWRSNMRPEAMKSMLDSGPRAPARFRAIGAPSNMTEFAQAFSCRPGDAMVRRSKEQATIW